MLKYVFPLLDKANPRLPTELLQGKTVAAVDPARIDFQGYTRFQWGRGKFVVDVSYIV
jgi:hypothetical protein